MKKLIIFLLFLVISGCSNLSPTDLDRMNFVKQKYPIVERIDRNTYLGIDKTNQLHYLKLYHNIEKGLYIDDDILIFRDKEIK